MSVRERGERARIVDDNAHVKGHGRPHANSYDSISSKGHLEYLFSPFLENIELIAKKQEGAPAPFFKHIPGLCALGARRKSRFLVLGAEKKSADWSPAQADYALRYLRRSRSLPLTAY